MKFHLQNLHRKASHHIEKEETGQSSVQVSSVLSEIQNRQNIPPDIRSQKVSDYLTDTPRICLFQFVEIIRSKMRKST